LLTGCDSQSHTPDSVSARLDEFQTPGGAGQTPVTVSHLYFLVIYNPSLTASLSQSQPPAGDPNPTEKPDQEKLEPTNTTVRRSFSLYIPIKVSIG